MPRPLFFSNNVIEGFQDQVPAYFTNTDQRAKNESCRDVYLNKNTICASEPGDPHSSQDKTNPEKYCTLDRNLHKTENIPMCHETHRGRGLPPGVCPDDKPHLYSQSKLSYDRQIGDTPYGKLCSEQPYNTEVALEESITPTNVNDLPDYKPSDTYSKSIYQKKSTPQQGKCGGQFNHMVNNPDAGGSLDIITLEDKCVDKFQLKPVGLPALDFRVIKIEFTEKNLDWFVKNNFNMNRVVTAYQGSIHYYIQFVSSLEGGSQDVGDWNGRIFWIENPEAVPTYFENHALDFTRIWATKENSVHIFSEPPWDSYRVKYNPGPALDNLKKQLNAPGLEFFKNYRGEKFHMSLFEHGGSGPGFLIKNTDSSKYGGSPTRYIPHKCEERSLDDCTKAVGCIKNAASCQTDNSLINYSKFNASSPNRKLGVLSSRDMEEHPSLSEKGAYVGSTYYTIDDVNNDSSNINSDTTASCLAQGGIVSGNKCIDPRLECLQTGTKYMPVTNPPLSKSQMLHLDQFFPYDTKCPISQGSFGSLSGPQLQRLGLISGGKVKAGPSSNQNNPGKNPDSVGGNLASMYIVFSDNYENPNLASREFVAKNKDGSDFTVMTGPFHKGKGRTTADLSSDMADSLDVALQQYTDYVNSEIGFAEMKQFSSSLGAPSNKKSNGYNWIVPVQDYIWCCDASVVDGGTADQLHIIAPDVDREITNPSTSWQKYSNRFRGHFQNSTATHYQWRCFRKTPANQPPKQVYFGQTQDTPDAHLEGTHQDPSIYAPPDPNIRQIHRIVPDPHKGPGGRTVGIIMIVDYDLNPPDKKVGSDGYQFDKRFNRCLMVGTPDGSILEPFDRADGDNPFANQSGGVDVFGSQGHNYNYLDVYAGHPDHVFLYRTECLTVLGETVAQATNPGLIITGENNQSGNQSGSQNKDSNKNNRYTIPTSKNPPLLPDKMSANTSPAGSGVSQGYVLKSKDEAAARNYYYKFKSEKNHYLQKGHTEMALAQNYRNQGRASTNQPGKQKIYERMAEGLTMKAERDYRLASTYHRLMIYVPEQMASSNVVVEEFTSDSSDIIHLSEKEQEDIMKKTENSINQLINGRLTRVNNTLFDPTAKIFSGSGDNYLYIRSLKSLSKYEPSRGMENTDIGKDGKKSLSYSSCTGGAIYRYDIKQLKSFLKNGSSLDVDILSEELVKNNIAVPCYSPSQVWWGNSHTFARDSLSSGNPYRKQSTDYRSVPLFENFDASDPDYIWATGMTFPQFNNYTDKKTGVSRNQLMPFGATYEMDGGWMKPVFNLFRCRKYKEPSKQHIFEWEVYEPVTLGNFVEPSARRVMNFAYDPQGQKTTDECMSLTEFVMRESLFYHLEKTVLKQQDITNLAKQSISKVLDADGDQSLSITDISPQLSLDPNDPKLVPDSCPNMPDMCLILYPRMDKIQSPYDICYFKQLKGLFSLWLKIDGKRMWIDDADWDIDDSLDLYASAQSWEEAGNGGWINIFGIVINNKQVCQWMGTSTPLHINYDYSGNLKGWSKKFSDFANTLFVVNYNIPMIIPDNKPTEEGQPYTLTPYQTFTPLSSFRGMIQTITKNCFFGLTPVSGQGSTKCSQWEYPQTSIQSGKTTKLVKQVLKPIYSINSEIDVRPSEWSTMVKNVTQKAMQLKRKDIIDSLNYENNTKILMSSYRDMNDHDSIMKSIMTHLDISEKKLSEVDSKIQNYQRQQEISDNDGQKRDEKLFMLKVILVYLLVISIPFILKYMFPNKGIKRYFTLIIAVVTIPFWIGVSVYLYSIRNRSNHRWQLRNYGPGKQLKKLEKEGDQGDSSEECDVIDVHRGDNIDGSQYEIDMEQLVDRARHEKYCIKHDQDKPDPKNKNKIKALEKEIKTLQAHQKIDKHKEKSLQRDIDRAEETIKQLQDARQSSKQ